MAEVEVTFAESRHRWEARVDGELAGFAEYELGDGLVTFTHTEVDDRFEGQGVGSALARYALDDVRAEGARRVRPECPFIARWISRHAEYQDLVEDASTSD